MTSQTPHEFLLMKHPNRWDLPKGHGETGESDLETALREMEEETGILSGQVSIDSGFEYRIEYPVTYKRWPGQTFRKRVCFFLGWVEEKPPLTLTEHPDARWWTWSPPHAIQEQTIDGLLESVRRYLGA